MHTASELAPPHADALRLLRTLLQRLSGFRVVLAQHNDPSYRDGLIASLADAAPGSETVDAKQLGDFAAFERWIDQRRESRAPLHLLNLESLSQAAREEFFRGLNYHREHLAQKARWPLVFWLTESGLNELARQAADFWAWREQVLDFTLPLEAVERRERFLAEIYNRDSPLKRQRIAEIEAHLATRPGEPDLADADMLAELGRLYLSIGDYPAARAKLEASIAAYATLGDDAAKAKAAADLAELLHRVGDPDRALQLLKTVALPVFERLVDIENVAHCLYARASILVQRSGLTPDTVASIRADLEQAFAILQKLQRADSIGIVGSLLAQALAAAAANAEALAVLDQVEQAWRKLGNERGLAEAAQLRRTIAS